jgi:hypothetical protein
MFRIAALAALTAQESSPQFWMLNDLDAVSRATPAYDNSYEIRWRVSDAVVPGNYQLDLEINKDFDTNKQHKAQRFRDPQLPQAGN